MKNRVISAAERIGQKFGRLTVIDVLPKGRIICRCDCGTIKNLQRSHVFWGGVKSCGCLVREQLKTHGKSGSPEYVPWMQMRGRCLNPTNPSFEKYGAIGIKIHPEWVESFQSFLDHIGKRPSKKHTIDRIDNEGHYVPGNVRWATKKEQAQNRKNSIWIEHEGRNMALIDWAAEIGISWGGLRKLLRRMDFKTFLIYWEQRNPSACPVNSVTNFLDTYKKDTTK